MAENEIEVSEGTIVEEPPMKPDSTVSVIDLTDGERIYALEQRQAIALSQSKMIPELYQDNIPDCLIAMELAHRTGSSTFMVMQNVYIVHGKPSWSSSFIIAAINSCKRFSALRYRLTGEGMARQCVAWARDADTGEEVVGPAITMQMAHDEGWSKKNGSKWKTMSELMLHYRAATVFGRLYTPDILMGMHTEEEQADIGSGPAPAAPAREEDTSTLSAGHVGLCCGKLKGRFHELKMDVTDEDWAIAIETLCSPYGITEFESLQTRDLVQMSTDIANYAP